MTPGDAAARELLGRSWDEVEADAAAYVEHAEAAVVRWAWIGPEADLWEEREPATGVETPMREVAEPDDDRRHRFAHFGTCAGPSRQRCSAGSSAASTRPPCV